MGIPACQTKHHSCPTTRFMAFASSLERDSYKSQYGQHLQVILSSGEPEDELPPSV